MSSSFCDFSSPPKLLLSESDCFSFNADVLTEAIYTDTFIGSMQAMRLVFEW